ncbi:hypothetical protein MNV49_001924 [Pseudohyphozyma bogoriensis]|nr:hypothetical protein MNV49_001924 [Pseudohyphozyma bogoriensis]
MPSTLRQRMAAKQADLSSSTASLSSDVDLDEGLPVFTPPPFTINELLKAIPAHCYERSALRSSLYVIQDAVLVSALVYAATFIDPAFGTNGAVLQGWQGELAKWAAWGLYWTFQGFVFTGVWILGHECGHQAFSTSKQINYIAGLFLHSFVLVPFHSWRISHSKHHAATGHLTRDEVFVPATKSFATKNYGLNPAREVIKDGLKLEQLLEDAPLYSLYWLVVQQLFGWPAYLFNNASGQEWYPKGTNHFMPSSKIFDARHRQDVLVSDAFLIAMLSGLTWISMKFGVGAMVKYYGIPYLLVNHWLVMITFLQHTDPTLPHYRAGEWTFARGALATIDRNMFGFVGPYLMHGITETHVAHHTCSKIPHYHAWEATEALKKFLGPHYNATEESMWVSLWKCYRICRFVDDEGDVLMYRDAYGRAKMQVAVEDKVSDSGFESSK